MSYHNVNLLRDDNTSSLPPVVSMNRRPISPTFRPSEDSLLYGDNLRRSHSASHVRFDGTAGSTTNLTTHVFDVTVPRPSTSTLTFSNKHQLEMQDRVKMLQEELNKRDQLIQKLTSLETPRISPKFEINKIEEVYSTEQANALAQARSESSMLRVKIEGLQKEVHDLKIQVELREDKLQSCRLDLETARENEARHISMVESLRSRIVEVEKTYTCVDDVNKRGELAVSTLTSQLNEANSKILELESRLRNYITEKEEYSLRVATIERKHREAFSKISTLLNIEYGDSIDIDVLIQRLSDAFQENAALRGKVLSMKDYVTSAEVETKACRETIMRLVTEAEKEQQSATKYSMEMDSLRVERDNAVAKLRGLELEIGSLQERLDSSQRAWSSTRQELEERDATFSRMEREYRETSTFTNTIKYQLKTFQEELVSLLCGDGLLPIEPTQEAIRERIRALVMAVKDKSAHIEVLESKVATVTDQLDKQYEMHRSADSRTKRVEMDYYSMQEQVKRLEGEVAGAGMLRDGLRMDKEKYFHFLEKMARILNVETITSDVGFDMAIDTLMIRIEQIVKNESDTLNDRKTHIYNLQRKVKALKEQLESRDLHIDLLRKKVTGMEERLVGKTELEKEKEGEAIRNRKLIKLVERYKRELHDASMELNDLKARSMESADLKTRTVEAEHEIQSLESKLSQLEMLRQKQAKKIAGLTGTLEVKETEVTSKHAQANNTIHALSSELRTTKSALEEITKRERQLLDLRQVVARMLGLDINSLAVPDYEIIARLEKLILAHQGNVVTATAVDAIVDGMEDGFREGYQDASRVFKVTRSRSPTRHVRTITTTTQSHMNKSRNNRSRSLSPSRRKDTRAY